jgi:hypothetical protein
MSYSVPFPVTVQFKALACGQFFFVLEFRV